MNFLAAYGGEEPRRAASMELRWLSNIEAAIFAAMFAGAREYGLNRCVD